MRYQFVDCRWELGAPAKGRELYEASHIPGASFLDVETDLSDPAIEDQGRHPLPSATRFAESAGRAGIDNDAFVIAYGTMGGAERLWWLLRHFGHDACAVIDLASWRGPLVKGAEANTVATFTARERSDDTISAEALEKRLADVILVDARMANRWRGEDNPVDKPPGRIPGAMSSPWNADLAEIPAGELVAYCGSGVTACVVLHRAHLAGRDGKLYPGSYSDWSKRALPTQRS
jgi:thiosulfate/3-mercaptopyruvate sulfurtransferase